MQAKAVRGLHLNKGSPTPGSCVDQAETCVRVMCDDAPHPRGQPAVTHSGMVLEDISRLYASWYLRLSISFFHCGASHSSMGACLGDASAQGRRETCRPGWEQPRETGAQGYCLARAVSEACGAFCYHDCHLIYTQLTSTAGSHTHTEAGLCLQELPVSLIDVKSLPLGLSTPFMAAEIYASTGKGRHPDQRHFLVPEAESAPPPSRGPLHPSS